MLELDLIELKHEPLIEVTKDGNQVWVEDRLVWEKENVELCPLCSEPLDNGKTHGSWCK